MKVSLMWECDTCDNLRAALYARRSTSRKNANTATWKTLPCYTAGIQRHFIAEKRFTFAVPLRFIPQAGLKKREKRDRYCCADYTSLRDYVKLN